jgi:hypothetical protein
MDCARDDDTALKKIVNLKRMIAFGLRFRISGGADELSQPTPENNELQVSDAPKFRDVNVTCCAQIHELHLDQRLEMGDCKSAFFAQMIGDDR